MTEMIELTAEDTVFDAYIARPAGEPRAGIVLVHEIWGLVSHTEDVADRFAREGYLVIAPDVLSKAGVPPKAGAELFAYASSTDEAYRAQGQPRLRELFSVARDPDHSAWVLGALVSATDWLVDALGEGKRVGVVGFCFGGNHTFALAGADTRIRAAVPFYGFRPSPEVIATTRSPILALYGELDTPLVEGLAELETDMAAAGVAFEAVVYPDAAHAFFNDTNAYQYNEDAARSSWQRVLDFLRSNLID